MPHKSELWLKVAKEMGVPPRAAEGMFWELGEKEIASRAGTIHSSHRLENPLPAGSIPVNDQSKRSDLTNFKKKSTIQLPSLRKVLSNLSACQMVEELPAIQSSVT
ncbi:MYB DNA-binding domain-containing protein [Penicillium sp. IBT 16267x]|nr:MYB DNA-binding domain-containing protein [Penicillium sp. IBT 16267x]